MKIVMALVAALAATPTWADSAADEAIRRAQVCSNDKAVKYSRETAESPQTIAEAAFDACESLWRVAVERLMDERQTSSHRNLPSSRRNARSLVQDRPAKSRRES
jgi:hypothetical protein